MTEAQVASWDRPGGDVKYAILDDADVDRDVMRAAMTGRAFAAWHLEMAPPPMGFYRPEGSAELAYRAKYGCADWLSFTAPEARGGHADRRTRTIGINAKAEPWLVAETSAHEVCHMTQSGRDVEAEEEEAEAYGVWAADVLVRRGKLASVHRHDGFPYSGITLKGLVDTADVLVDTSSGTVFRNFGLPSSPRWVRHHTTCPVELGGRA